MAFLEPSVPIATFDALDCAECPVADSIHCHFRQCMNLACPLNGAPIRSAVFFLRNPIFGTQRR